MRQDGSVEVGCRIASAPDDDANHIHLEQAGKTLALIPEQVVDATPTTADTPRREAPRPGQVLRFIVPPDIVRHGPATLVLGTRRIPLALRPLPSAADPAPVRLAVAGAINWPDQTTLDRLATSLGGPVDAVIALGNRLEYTLGDGGWENTTPICVLGTTSDTGLLHAHARWPTGLTWGLVGMPIGADADALRAALARDLSPWLVPVVLNTPWNPMVGTEQGQVSDLLPFLVPCRQFRVPVLLLAGSAAGWISEPLNPTKGRLIVQAGGTRAVSATPAGGPLGTQPDELALTLTHPALIGLAATPDHLTLVVQSATDDSPPLRLNYPVRPVDAANPPPSSGWGDGTPDAAREAALGPRDTPEQRNNADTGLARLTWLPAPVLGTLHLGNDDFTKLVGNLDQPAALLLLRRMACCEALIHDHLAPLGERLPASVRHDLALRHAAKPLTVDETVWSRAITMDQDPDLLRAVITACERNTDHLLAHLLLERLRNQAAGSVPLEHDPLLQHRLLCVVFESPHLSPTPLRQIALTLRDKVDALSRGPIERFLARVGEKRPTP
jgi:hypothetical protein